MDFLKHPWPWYVAGPLIGLMVPLLLLIGNKALGVSSSMRHICAAIIPSDISYFKYDWKKEAWNLFFVAGIFLGAVLTVNFLSDNQPLHISDKLVAQLQEYGVKDFSTLMPSDLFSFSKLFTLKGFLLMIVGGFLVGFGTRYAGGCTSGHSIMGISSLQLPSLITTCCFLIGGFIMANIFLPLILSLH